MAKFLIVGCGDIGSRVGRHLLDTGHTVSGLRRSPPATCLDGANSAQIDYIKADLTSREDISALSTDFDQIIYIVTPGASNEEAYRKVFEFGVDNLLSHFTKHNLKTHSIFVSSTRVYGQNLGEWVDENSPTVPIDSQGSILLSAESKFLKQHSLNTVVRFSGIYGRSSNGFLKQSLQGDDVQFDPPYYTNRIHYLDCIQFIVYLAQLKCSPANKSIGPVYLVSDDDPAPKWEIADWFCVKSALSSPPKKMAPGAPQNKRCLNRRMKDLGYSLLFESYKEGYAAQLN